MVRIFLTVFIIAMLIFAVDVRAEGVSEFNIEELSAYKIGESSSFAEFSADSYDNSILNSIAAEREESLSQSKRGRNSDRNWYRSDDPYDFAIRDIILPSALILVGTSSLYIDGVSDFDRYVNGRINRYNQNKYTFDDYLQYAPYLMLWTLDACGVESRHRFKEQTTNLAVAMSIMGILTNVGKYTLDRQRPSKGSSHNSMPSGHTAMVFVGAEFLRMEFAGVSPWIGVSGYAIATTTAFMRVWNNAHWVTDTLVGAGVGILSVRIANWIAPSLNGWLWGSDLRAEESPLEASLLPYTDGQSYGVNLQLSF